MPWKEASAMSLRSEFIALATGQGIDLSELARRFQISRKTAYKWLARARAGEGLEDRSRRPKHSPSRTADAVEAAIVDLRRDHPQWGGRTLTDVLRKKHVPRVPAPSTVTDVLRRHGLIEPADTAQRTAWKRFEHASPNDLWQMDFKGTMAVGQGKCDPLTALDDHSRYNLVLRATTDQRGSTVQNVLTDAFRRYGLPRCINTDNGNPWGIPSGRSRDLSAFAIWLVRVGIHLTWSAPGHPQTNGKVERFHRSFKAEVVRGRTFTDLAHAQRAFDEWRMIYNEVRPHQGIDMAVPADRYQPSPRPFPEVLPAIEYAPQDTVLKVDARGRSRLQKHDFVVSTALGGHLIAARPRDGEDGLYDLYFSHQKIGEIDLNDPA
jgi:transposase InsO family protein